MTRDSAPSEVTVELVQDVLAAELERALPELALTDAEQRRLAATIVRIRDTTAALREREHTPEHAQALRDDRARLVADLQTIAEITGMSAVELSAALSDEGLSTTEPQHEDVTHESLSLHPPR